MERQDRDGGAALHAAEATNPDAPMISLHRMAGLIVGALLVAWLLGLLNDIIRVAIWEAGAAAAMLIWYGPLRRLWQGNRKD